MGSKTTIIVSDLDLPESESIWGTGGWVPPEQREGLDWLTLLILMGWDINVVRLDRPNENIDPFEDSQRIIVACDIHEIPEHIRASIKSKLKNEPICIITRLGDKENLSGSLWQDVKKQGYITGRDLGWNGRGKIKNWKSRSDLEIPFLHLNPGSELWATCNGKPIIAAHQFEKGIIVTLSFHPSEMRDKEGVITALLKHMLVWSLGEKQKCVDFSGCMILRMDDPGGSQNVFNRSWAHQKINQKQWDEIGLDLKRRQGRMSIGYVSGWVDDGDLKRGRLHVAGEIPNRLPGKTYPSQLVEYEDLNGHQPGIIHDYPNEYQSIKALLDKGIVDIALHGYTHINPDSNTWAHAADRYECVDWYRELGESAREVLAERPALEHPLYLGMSAIKKYFGIIPSTLICPGDEWTNEALEYALKLGLQLVSNYYLAIRYEGHLCWATHVCAPYLDEPDAKWFDSELPVIGYLHDRDIAIYGMEWFTTNLDKWQEDGAKKFINYEQFISILNSASVNNQ